MAFTTSLLLHLTFSEAFIIYHLTEPTHSSPSVSIIFPVSPMLPDELGLLGHGPFNMKAVQKSPFPQLVLPPLHSSLSHPLSSPIPLSGGVDNRTAPVVPAPCKHP